MSLLETVAIKRRIWFTEMFFRRQQPKASLQLRVDEGPFHVGSTFNVTVTLVTDEDLYIRSGRVELVTAETIWKGRVEERGVYQKRQTVRNVYSSESFLSDIEVLNGIPYQMDLGFSIPAGSPPTIKGEIVEISWMLRGTVDIARSAERPSGGFTSIEQKQLISVMPALRSDTLDSIKETTASHERKGRCTVSLSCPPGRIGEALNGTLTAEVWRNLNVNEVRVELGNVEEAGEKSETTITGRQVLQNKASLLANEIYEWPFQVHVPAGLTPTFRTQRGSYVQWFVRGGLRFGVLPRLLGADINVYQTVQIDSG